MLGKLLTASWDFSCPVPCAQWVFERAAVHKRRILQALQDHPQTTNSVFGVLGVWETSLMFNQDCRRNTASFEIEVSPDSQVADAGPFAKSMAGSSCPLLFAFFVGGIRFKNILCWAL